MYLIIAHHPGAAVYLDEVQEAPDWQRLVRSLLDAGRSVCVTGSNASLLGRELGSKLTGRHVATEAAQTPCSQRKLTSRRHHTRPLTAAGGGLRFAA